MNHKMLGVAAIAMAAALALGYQLGRGVAGAPAQVAAPAVVTAPVTTAAAPSAPVTAPPATTPAAPSAQAPAPAAATQAVPGGDAAAHAQAYREGKVQQVDPAAKFTHFRVGSKNVKRILVDGPLVWVGTSGGLVRYDTRGDAYKLYDVKNGLLSNGIFHVGKIGGRIVAGTYGGGLAVLDTEKDTWKTYNIPEGLGDAFVYDVLEAKNGDVWIATWSGVNRVKGGRLDDRASWELHTVESTKGGLPNDWVYGLAEGRDGDVWLATEGGLALNRANQWQNWNHAKGLGADYERVKNAIDFKTDPSKVSEHHARQKEEMGLQKIDVAYNPNYVVSMVVDREGVVWAGTWGGGLSRYDGKAWKQYTVTEGLPGNHVFMLHLDPEGAVWVGTNQGLAKMNGERFDVMTTQHGLFTNAVFSMATGADGSRWVGGYGGVARLRPP